MSKAHKKLDLINKTLELPDGVLSNGTNITLQSNKTAVLDGRCCVIAYDEKLIKINTGNFVVTFKGINLNLDALETDSAIISGEIYAIEFS